MFNSSNNLSKNSNLLGIKVKNYGECGWCLDEENKVSLNIPWDVWSQWMHISHQMGNKEWGGVFWVKDNTITDFKLPKQEVTSAECEFKEELGGDGIVHSHHNMGAFHSLEDDRHARNLYAYSIVISNAKGYEATKRVKLPCGGFGYVKVELFLSGCPEIDLSKITRRKQELMPEIFHGDERQQQLDFETDEFLCDKCDSFKCKTCKLAIGRGNEGMLPFCDYCEEYESCRTCLKMAKYLENYPEDRRQFEYLYADGV